MSLLTPLVPIFPNQLTNGTVADASQVMADFNNLRNAINNSLNATGATGGDQYVGLTTNSRYQGTSVFDALTQILDRFQEADSGAVNALTISPTPAVSAYGQGMFFLVVPGNTTTSSTPTLKVGTAAAITIVNGDGTAHVPGTIQANRPALFWVDSVNSKAAHLNPVLSFAPIYDRVQEADTGAVNALVITPSPAITAYGNNQYFGVVPANTTTTTTPTINVNGKGALTIVNADGTAHVAGSMQAGRYAMIWIDNANSKAVHLNPLPVTGSFTGTIATGLTTMPTFTVNTLIHPLGRLVSISTVGAQGTGSTIAMTVTGVPNTLVSASAGSVPFAMQNNSSPIIGGFSTGSTTWTCSLTWGGGSFTASGSKGFGPVNASLGKMSWTTD